MGWAVGAYIPMTRNDLKELTPSRSGVMILTLDDAIEFVLHEADSRARHGEFEQAQRLYQRVIKLTEGASNAARQKLTSIRQRLSELDLDKSLS
jgi:hypothetical protein